LSSYDITMIGEVGNTYQLNASLSNGQSLDPSLVTFTSSNPSVAAVDSYGLITAGSPGTAVITITYGSYTAKCTVTVDPPGSYSG